MSPLGSAGIVETQSLMNIGQISVTARGSMFCSGLLMKPMKRSNWCVPLRKPLGAPWELFDGNRQVSGLSGYSMAPGAPLGAGMASWLMAVAASASSDAKLHNHFINSLLLSPGKNDLVGQSRIHTYPIIADRFPMNIACLPRTLGQKRSQIRQRF